MNKKLPTSNYTFSIKFFFLAEFLMHYRNILHNNYYNMVIPTCKVYWLHDSKNQSRKNFGNFYSQFFFHCNHRVIHTSRTSLPKWASIHLLNSLLLFSGRMPFERAIAKSSIFTAPTRLWSEVRYPLVTETFLPLLSVINPRLISSETVY